MHEVVVVRSELQTLLMPRPAVPKAWLQDGKGRGFRKGQKGGDKGRVKGLEKGDGKGKEGFMVGGLRVGLWYNQTNQRRNLCKDFQLGKCVREKCRFGHSCGVIIGKGRVRARLQSIRSSKILRVDRKGTRLPWDCWMMST